jgi:hypothetical protein
MNVSSLVSYLDCLSRKRPCSELARRAIDKTVEILLDADKESVERWQVEDSLVLSLVSLGASAEDRRQARAQILAILDETERYIGR